MRFQRSSVRGHHTTKQFKLKRDNDDENDNDLANTKARLFLRNRRAKMEQVCMYIMKLLSCLEI